MALASLTDRVLDCPVCLDWLQPPVSLCKNGHGTCGKCRESIDTCPVCRSKFTDFKNTLVDKIVESLLIRCPNYSLGCEKCFSPTEIKKHGDECLFRIVNCRVCEVKNIPISSLNDHFNVAHEQKASRLATSFSEAVCLNVDLQKLWVKIIDFQDFHFNFIITGKIILNFLVRLFYNTEKHVLYICIQFLGKEQEKANKYIFNVKVDQKLPSSNEPSFFTLSGLCSPYYEHVKWVKADENEKEFIGLKMNSIFLNYDYLSKAFGVEITIKELLP